MDPVQFSRQVAAESPDLCTLRRMASALSPCTNCPQRGHRTFIFSAYSLAYLRPLAQRKWCLRPGLPEPNRDSQTVFRARLLFFPVAGVFPGHRANFTAHAPPQALRSLRQNPSDHFHDADDIRILLRFIRTNDHELDAARISICTGPPLILEPLLERAYVHASPHEPGGPESPEKR